ncbi:hypothetical protein [Peribacillus sp. AS_2]|uniref:sunset domain-containing protein n=1 Tax=Peribacillus sp. AS_2 TaxID=2996755 RepID=UPI0022A6A6BF|nr:hypothetical protein [Peribacillus sp. AS_2]MCZ0872755.1 hypothetical protein [Peribacillus sp. AS_2]
MNKYVKAFLIIYVTATIIIIFTQTKSASSGDCSDPQIKGNETTYNGEKIYHTPDGKFYDVTDAEEWFCTEEDAEAAGYRMSER